MRHHPVFSAFVPWSGTAPEGSLVDFLGVRTRRSYYSLYRDLPQPLEPFIAPLPEFDEEYFEWIDLLEAVKEADQCFTIMELGAGFGRWSARAAAACRQGRGKSLHVIAVEAEPTHVEMLRTNFLDNGLRSDQFTLLEAALTHYDGTTRFHVGQPDEWYGQSICESSPGPDHAGNTAEVREVPAVSLNTLLGFIQRVDLIDMDIQNAELTVLRPARQLLQERVRRMHVATHSAEAEQECRDLFWSLGWKCLNDYASQRVNVTPFGDIAFGDGVQSWLNSNLKPQGLCK
jgi:FkbM family methyltransferase